jgi:hypothetical protein
VHIHELLTHRKELIYARRLHPGPSERRERGAKDTVLLLLPLLLLIPLLLLLLLLVPVRPVLLVLLPLALVLPGTRRGAGVTAAESQPLVWAVISDLVH